MSTRTSLFVYRRRPTPLHTARASVGASWCAAVALAGLAGESPVVLASVLAAVLAAGVLADVGGELWRSLRVAAIVAVPIVSVNVLVSREGLTVFARLGDLGPFGQGHLTVEALVYGAIVALKVTILMLATTLASLAVNPDELLRGARRLSFRSALTVSLATRMLPVLAGDARRLADAQRTRPTGGLEADGRTARGRARARLVGAVVASSLDRALDIAATLELRGFAHGRRAQRRRTPLSRHDLAFAASALALIALTLVAKLTELAPFAAYPQVHAGPALAACGLGAALAALALLPFADPRGTGA